MTTAVSSSRLGRVQERFRGSTGARHLLLALPNMICMPRETKKRRRKKSLSGLTRPRL